MLLADYELIVSARSSLVCCDSRMPRAQMVHVRVIPLQDRMITHATFTTPTAREMLGRHLGTHAGLDREDAPGYARRAKA